MFGVMIDCSRNAVMNTESLKTYIDLLCRMGYDTLMLYTEDTYEIDGHPCFGHQRGRYSKAELKEIDAYCREKKIELIPCIQTLAHLNAMFRWRSEYEDIRDCGDVLLTGEEKTLSLIRDMFKTAAECFTSRRIHIGMDEAFSVGLGKYLFKHGLENRFDIINRHLHDVCRIADEFGFSPMIWSDMFCRFAMNKENYYAEGDTKAVQELAALPENISLVYWDYYQKDQKKYEDQIRINKLFGREVIFAGGVWTWRGFLPDNRLAFDVTKPALAACRACGIEDIFLTLWGDDGGECSLYAALPALLYAAKLAGRCSEETAAQLEPSLQKILAFEKMDHPTGGRDMGGHQPSKYLLYNDPFTGLLNHAVPEGADGFYRELASELAGVEKEVSEDEKLPQELRLYGKFAAALCELLAVKSELGPRTKKAYLAGDREEVRRIAEEEYTEACERLKAFHKAYMAQWMCEKKPHGFDMQDIRLGGLMQRLLSCRERLLAWCDGSLAAIPELEEEDLPVDLGTFWYTAATANVMAHGL